jgi:hypothetical protein
MLELRTTLLIRTYRTVRTYVCTVQYSTNVSLAFITAKDIRALYSTGILHRRVHITVCTVVDVFGEIRTDRHHQKQGESTKKTSGAWGDRLRTEPCLVLPCLALSCLALSCLVLSCLVLPCLVLSCLVFPLDYFGDDDGCSFDCQQ